MFEVFNDGDCVINSKKDIEQFHVSVISEFFFFLMFCYKCQNHRVKIKLSILQASRPDFQCWLSLQCNLLYKLTLSSVGLLLISKVKRIGLMDLCNLLKSYDSKTNCCFNSHRPFLILNFFFLWGRYFLTYVAMQSLGEMQRAWPLLGDSRSS